ncbi:MAG: YciI family protein [Oceanicaulis sp.]
MKFTLLLHDDEQAWLSMSEAEQGAVISEHMAYVDALIKAGAMVSGEPLDPAGSAKIVRGGAVQDGPYADTREQLGGFAIVEADSLDDALSWAERCPAASAGAVEVRPVLPMADVPEMNR